MHEMGLTDAMLRMVDDILKKESMQGASRITVEIGALSGVIPRFLKECWTAVAAGTRFQETELVLVETPGSLRCEDCGTVFSVRCGDDLTCPDCLGKKLTPISGQDMTILEIEAY